MFNKVSAKQTLNACYYTPNANMAVHSVAARDELYESEASEASVFCSVNASPEKSCIVVNIWSFLFRYAYELLCF